MYLDSIGTFGYLVMPQQILQTRANSKQMNVTFKEGQTYKLKPTKTQESLLWQFAGGARWIWNQLFNLVENYFFETGHHISPLTYATFITDWKRDPNLSWLSEIHSQVLQQPARDLNTAYAWCTA
jgi:hypothetical protein